MMSNTVHPVVIAGAGPTGLTAAVELSRFQIPVRLIERLEGTASTSRAIGVQARTLELLERRGLAEQFVALGVHGQGASIYGDGKLVFRLKFSRLDSRYNYLLLISEAETERILRERVEQQGVKIERGVELTAFKQDDSSVTAVLRHKDGHTEEYKASYLIDAEGAHSIVRTTLGLQFEGKTLEQTYVLADLHVDSELSDTEIHIFSSEHGFMGLFPLGKQHFRLVADHPINGDHSGDPRLEECQAIYEQRSHIRARFHGMTWSSYFHINSRMVPQVRVGRVFLGGDSAHIHSPAGAQGMNTGIQDMINLAWKLAYTLRGEGNAELLDTYQADRVPVMRDVLQKTERLTDAMGSENRIFRTLFNHLVPLIAETDLVQENAAERMSQLAVNYRKSPLSEDHGPAHGIHAGDRVPELSVQLASGGLVRVLELLDPSRFTLLAVTGPLQSVDLTPFKELVRDQPNLQFFHVTKPEHDPENSFARVFGEASASSSREPLVYLIRPDGYVGLRTAIGDTGRIGAYLNRWLSNARDVARTASR